MNIFALIEKYLALAVIGVHAAATVPASNSDKRATVLATAIAIGDALSTTATDPKVQLVGAMVDMAATVINKLTTPKPAPMAPPPITPAAPVVVLGNLSGVGNLSGGLLSSSYGMSPGH